MAVAWTKLTDKFVDKPSVRIFVQARMNSVRLPGKMLAPFRGRPMVDHVMAAGRAALPDPRNVILLTSTAATDDPLAAYADVRRWSCFRGDLENVLKRYVDAAKEFPSTWIIRICGDSPLIMSRYIQECLAVAEAGHYDVVTNVRPRTFPKGHSVEIVKADIFKTIEMEKTTGEQREHVLPWFYKNVREEKIYNVKCPADFPFDHSCAIDVLDDLKRLESL